MFALVAALALGAMPALAVHSNTGAAVLGALEIDGNVIQQSTGEDWQTLFRSGGVFNCSTTASGGTANSKTCVSERLSPNATIFTGGGSKDGLDIPNWAGKDGSVPDKDDIVTAFAARYTSGTDQILYFGGDRFANNGDAQIGFWFFQNPVAFNPGTGRFSGTHLPGDILILSDFTVGGTLTNIQALVVTAISASGDVSFTTIAAAAAGTTFACDDAAGNGTGPHNICAATNAGNTTSLDPAYQDKSGTTVGTYPPVVFFEGGLNLSAFGLGSECFASFLMETRSSQSITAVLKDFVLGNFQACQASARTEIHLGSPPDPGAADIQGTGIPGNSSIHDKIFVTGEPNRPAVGAGGMGTATFKFFNNGTCAGTPLSIEGPLSLLVETPPTTTTGGISTVESSVHGPLAPGSYSFLATYNGDDPNYPNAVTAVGRDGINPCESVLVETFPSTVNTRIILAGTNVEVTNSAQNLNGAATVAVQDEATVTCDTVASIGGTVTFTRFNNGNCSGAPASSEIIAVVAGSPGTAKALSSVVNLGPNTLCFQAVYNGDGAFCAPSTQPSKREPVCALDFTTTQP